MPFLAKRELRNNVIGCGITVAIYANVKSGTNECYIKGVEVSIENSFEREQERSGGL